MTTFLIVIGAIVALVIVLSMKRSKKRVVGNMSNWANGAKAITYMQFVDDWDNRRLPSDLTFGIAQGMNKEDLTKTAAAVANHLFGESPSEMHLSLNLPTVHADALRWLNLDEGRKEMVVQAIRVFQVVEFSATGQSSGKGIEILQKYGKEFPASPDPESFHEVLKRELNKLSPRYRDIGPKFGIAA